MNDYFWACAGVALIIFAVLGGFAVLALAIGSLS